MRRPLPILFLAFIAGLLLARSFPLSPGWIVSITLVIVLLFLAALLRSRQSGQNTIWVFFTLLTVALGALRYAWIEETNRKALDIVHQAATGTPVELSGRISSTIEHREGVYRLNVSEACVLSGDKSIILPFVCRVSGLSDDPPAVQYGDRIVVQGTLSPIRAASLPGGFDYQEYLASRNIHAQLWCGKSPLQNQGNMSLTGWQRFLSLAFALRQNTLNAIQQSLPEPHAGLMTALLLGERSNLSPQVTRSLTNSGLIHLTAISGLHITFLVGFLFLAFKHLGMKRSLAAFLTVPCILIFLAMVEFQLPTIRAAVMGWAVLISYIVERDVDPLSSISAAGLGLLLWTPLAVFQAGFQMSFLAVSALVVLTPRWESLLPEGIKRGRRFWSALGASLIAQAAVAPIIALNHSIWTPGAILGNLLAIPLTGLLMIGGLGYILSSIFWSGMASLIALMVHPLLWFLEQVVKFQSGLPWSHFHAPGLHPLGMIAWYGVLAVLSARHLEIAVPRIKLRLSRIPLTLALLALMIWAGVFRPSTRELEINFLSLGQGDCVYLEFPGGGNLLVDGGPYSAPGARPPELIQYLRRRGIRRISAVVNTHPQSDHIGVLSEVFAEFEVEAFLDCGIAGSGNVYEDLKRAVEQEGCRWYSVQRDEKITGFHGAEIEVLNPNPRYRDDPTLDVNYQSVVLRITYGDFSCLLTGDIPIEIESELIRTGAMLQSLILKVPHHGSAYSSSLEFLDSIRPEVAIIQVGRNNYGHPAPRTLERLRESGSLILRNDLHGTILIRSDGKRYSVHAMYWEGMN